MKNSTTLFLFCPGIAGYAVCLADTAPPEAGMSVDEKLSSDAKNIRFTPTAAGKYPFYCKNKLLFFKSHRDKGMQGVLDVVP